MTVESVVDDQEILRWVSVTLRNPDEKAADVVGPRLHQIKTPLQDSGDSRKRPQPLATEQDTYSEVINPAIEPAKTVLEQSKSSSSKSGIESEHSPQASARPTSVSLVPQNEETGGFRYTVSDDARIEKVSPDQDMAWRRGQYPLQAQTDIVQLTSNDQEPAGLENDTVSRYSVDSQKSKGLRRSPRSQSLRENAAQDADRSAGSEEGTSPQSEQPQIELEEEEVQHSVDEPVLSTHDPWKRGSYPLYGRLSFTSKQRLDPNNAQQHSPPDSADHHVNVDTVATREDYSVADYRQPQPNDLPVSPPSSISDDPDGSSSLAQSAVQGAAKIITLPMRRRGYPLQASASNANLRHSPSPPPSPIKDQEQAAAAYVIDKTSAPTSIKSFRRRAYPLQSPVSIMDLNSAADSGTSPDLPATGVPRVEEEIVPSEMAKIRSFRRQKYPLQSPASIVDLKHTLSEPVKPHEVVGTSESSPAEPHVRRPQFQTTSTSFRRQVYPLQSPASTTDLKYQPVEDDSARTGSPVDGSGPQKEYSQGYAQDGRRYPLQQTLNVPSLLVSSPSHSMHPMSKGEEGIDHHKHDREAELTSKVVKQWRRQVYPLQGADHSPPFERTPTPQPHVEDEQQKKPAGPIHLPKHLQAVKDAEKGAEGGRTIIVCLDGTGDKFDNDNSNIVHIISALKKDDPKQVTYYQSGIGTYTDGGGLSSGISAALDMAVGFELGLHVRDAYQFLMHSYKEGDKICILGFSRGAYTARCLAGMLHKVGLLPPRNLQQIAFAYEFYANDTKEGWKQSQLFKNTFSIDVCVHFLGCFDSVASVGFIPRQLPLSTTPTNKPRFFRHAMALDERRAKFKVCRHQTTNLDDITDNNNDHNSPSTNTTASTTTSLLHSLLPNQKSQDDTPPTYNENYHPSITDEEYTALNTTSTITTDVLEVWFAGAHADIGGGAVPNDERHKLAQIPLRWMIRQTFACDTGIIWKTRKLVEFGLDVHGMWPVYEELGVPKHGPPPSVLEKFGEKGLPPREVRRGRLVDVGADEKGRGEGMLRLDLEAKGEGEEENSRVGEWTPEQVEDFYDAMAPVNDQLVQAPRWWVLEVWPVEYKVPVAPGKVELATGMNLGRYRGVDDAEPNLHWTALRRQQHMGYKIQVRTAPRTKWKIVV